MSPRLVLLAVLVVAACSQQGQPPSAASSAAPSALASCKLPVVSWYQPGNSGNVVLPSIGVEAHYLSYPGGAISATPTDEFTNVLDGFGWRSTSAPALRRTGPVGSRDSHGIWLGGSAILLYQPGHGTTKIATFPGFPANGCL
jgi:hypothetical protein